MVPPPMSATDITTNGNIIDFSISLTGDRIVILTAMGIEVYEWNFRSKPAAVLRRIASWSSRAQADPWSNTRFRQILVQDKNIIILVSYSISGGTKISSYAIEDSSGTLRDTCIDLDPLDNDQVRLIRNMYTDANHSFLWAQAATGLNCLNQPDLSSSSAVHPYTEIVVVEGHAEDLNEVHDYAPKNGDQASKHAHVFSLSRKGELFANDKLLTRGCTSFVSTNAHLIFTTSVHLLKFVHLDTSDGRYRSFPS